MNEYISKQSVLDYLNGYLHSLGEGGAGGADDLVFDRGQRRALINAIQDISAVKAADVQPVNQWISVKDRLPDKSCECLGIVDGEVTEVSYSPKCKELICVWSMCDADGSKPLPDDAVTHWMPLPEPPKEDDAE